MSRLSPAAICALWTLVWLSPVAAQEEAGGQPLPDVVVVDSVAPGDLLNIRATASATGIVLGQLPNGAPLRTRGCDEVNGYKWCKVSSLEDRQLEGWTPARYLRPAEENEFTAEQAAAAAETLAVVDPSLVETPGGPNLETNVEAAAPIAPEVPAEMTAPAEIMALPATVPLEAADPAPPNQPGEPPESLPMPQPTPAEERNADQEQSGASAVDAPSALANATPVVALNPQDEVAATTGHAGQSASLVWLALCACPVVLLAIMAALSSFGSFTFPSSPWTAGRPEPV